MKRILYSLTAVAIAVAPNMQPKLSRTCKRALIMSNQSTHELFITHSYGTTLADFIYSYPTKKPDWLVYDAADQLDQSAQAAIDRETQRQKLVDRCLR